VKKKDGETARQQQRLEFQAAKRVIPWTGLSSKDYDFTSWAKNGSKGLLRAGCVYEYARESRKLRCLLVLINLAFQKARQAEKTHSRPPFHGLQFLSLSFEGLRYKDAHLWLGGWFGWLRNFTDQLADNTSFAHLYEENEKQIDESLSTLPRYFYAPRAVEFAVPSLNENPVEPRLLWPWQALDARPRNIENDVIITVRIRRDSTKKEILDAMEVLVSMLRPSTEKEPTRKGTGKKDSPRSWLDALCAMRLASHYPKTLPSESIRKQRRRRWRGSDTAVSIFNDIRLGGKTETVLTHSDLEEKSGDAQRQFARCFPFGESPANGITWAERRRRNQ
jgi:hypothetical protein